MFSADSATVSNLVRRHTDHTTKIFCAMCVAIERDIPMRRCWFAAFFAFGAMMCALTVGLLLFPGGPFDALWRLNPDARLGFESLGRWSFVIMVVVGTACLAAAIGLWRGALWGTRLALAIFAVNITGDIMNVFFRQDYRALIGVPVGALMIFLLARQESAKHR
jgi:hypothetical protein